MKAFKISALGSFHGLTVVFSASFGLMACNEAPSTVEVAESEAAVVMDCTGLPFYLDIPVGTPGSYPAGYTVQAEGEVYQCLYSGGWCGQPVYGPPTGWAWPYAWNHIGTCEGANPPEPTNPCEGQADGTSCDDGNACTVGDVCLAGQCNSGLIASCDASCPAINDCSGVTCGDTNACGATCGSACDSGCPGADAPECASSCGGLFPFAAGSGYEVGDQVESDGEVYECLVRGWCDQEAYAPGVGWAWTNAWTLVGPCP